MGCAPSGSKVAPDAPVRVPKATRLSKQLTQKLAMYDVIVVGSGYGGGIAASRLARAGRKVAVLERGREFLLGEFPDDPLEAASNLRITFNKAGAQLGSADALFDLRFDDDTDQHVLVGNGLGGTSLINANVAVEADARALSSPEWPAAIRNNPEVLKEYYARARTTLNASPYPQNHRRLPKVEALKQSCDRIAARLGAKHIDMSYEDGSTKGEPTASKRVEFVMPPLAVSWRDDDNMFVNPQGVEQRGCTMCGDCCTGCNVGAKNTTQMNYLADAVQHGADIFTEVNVLTVEQCKSGEAKWRITYKPTADHLSERYAFDESNPFMFSDIVVLGAGSLGSTEILMRSKQQGLGVSESLGDAWSGNGGLLGFAYNSEQTCTGLGLGTDAPRSHDDAGAAPSQAIPADMPQPPGPCIAGMIKYKDDDSFESEFAVEDACPPGAVVGALIPALALASVVGGDVIKDFTESDMDSELDSVKRGLVNAFRGAHYPGSSSQHTHSLLGVCHDGTAGKLVWDEEEGRTIVQWQGAGASDNVKRLKTAMSDIAEQVKGEFVPNPVEIPNMDWVGRDKLKGETLISVHPLGGCQMGDSPADGVVNDRCQVFDCSGVGAPGEDGSPPIFDGLYVADGAVIPRSLAVNPYLTICAVAERAMALHITEQVKAGAPASEITKQPWKELDLTTKLKRLPDVEAAATTVGIAFTEAMTGYISSVDGETGEARNFDTHPALQYTAEDLEKIRQCKENGKANGLGPNFRFALTATLPDIAEALANPEYKGRITGSVRAPTIDEQPMQVTQGCFTVFAEDTARQVGTGKQMRYTFWMTTRKGKRFYFEGFKLVHDEGCNVSVDLCEAWKDTTTLFVTIWDSDRTHVLHRGMLRIKVADLLTQATTMRVLNADNFVTKMKAMWDFGTWFMGNAWDTYGSSLFRAPVYPDTEPRKQRKLRAPAPKPYMIKQLADGSMVRLTRFKAGTRGPVLLVHPFAMASSCWKLDTIDCSMVETLAAEKYDIWLLDWRCSTALKAKIEQEVDRSMDAAADDIDAAVEFMLNKCTGVSKIDIVCMCAGSMATACSILRPNSTTLKAVRSICAMSCFTHFETSLVARGKAGCMSCCCTADTVEDVIPSVNVAATDTSSWVYAMDAALGSLTAQDNINNATDARIRAVYGKMYQPDQMNKATMACLHELLGAGATDSMHHFAKITGAGNLVDAKGEGVYLPQLQQLASQQVKILLISGAEDRIWYPNANIRAEQALKQAGATVAHTTIDGYGHIDLIVGRNAVTDVWRPHILPHLASAESM